MLLPHSWWLVEWLLYRLNSSPLEAKEILTSRTLRIAKIRPRQPLEVSLWLDRSPKCKSMHNCSVRWAYETLRLCSRHRHKALKDLALTYPRSSQDHCHPKAQRRLLGQVIQYYLMREGVSSRIIRRALFFGPLEYSKRFILKREFEHGWRTWALQLRSDKPCVCCSIPSPDPSSDAPDCRSFRGRNPVVIIVL